MSPLIREDEDTLGASEQRVDASEGLIKVYYAQLDCDPPGCFPFLLRREQRMFVCLDRKLLVKIVWRFTKKEEIDRVQFVEAAFVLDSEVDNLGRFAGFSASSDPIFVITWPEYRRLLKEEEKPIAWISTRGPLGRSKKVNHAPTPRQPIDGLRRNVWQGFFF